MSSREPEQLPLRLSFGLLEPATRVACVPLRAELAASSCARMHAATIPSGHGRGSPVFPRCAGCGMGEARLAVLRAQGWTPAPFRVFNVNRDASQRAARARLSAAGMLDEVPTLDAPPPDEER